MSGDILPPDSGLVAIALIIRSKNGPQFVFHYPPRPESPTSSHWARFGTELDQGELDDNEEGDEATGDSDLEDHSFGIHHTFGKLDLQSRLKGGNGRQNRQMDASSFSSDDHYDAPNGDQVVPWERVGEFSTRDLESILTPSRAFHKQKFELSLDPHFFVSYPMHIREDGLWKKKKPKKSKKSRSPSELPRTKSSDKVKDEIEIEEANLDKLNDQSDEEPCQINMTMFNVVFILQVPKNEEDYRVIEIYEHVIKKFSKALKHVQAQNEYVWKESEMILSMKDKAREERRPMSWLWSHILLKSTLAVAMRDLFIAISTNQIATLHLGSKQSIDLSLQIPVPAFLMSLPNPTERAMPGVLLTTANPMMFEDGTEDPTYLNKHFALLLLNDEDKIISEISADDTELSAPLIECIKLFKPTLSFHQVAQANAVDLPSILILAQHLIYWRKAIAIPPLHQRDTYIVSPNCDSTMLPKASAVWASSWPLAPSLPSFLADLSAAPRPYKTFSPSTDHRATYLEMLAWLIRDGWVTQLRTFAWILVWPEIVYEVDYELKAKALAKAQNPHAHSHANPFSSSPSTSNSTSTSPTDSVAPVSPSSSSSGAFIRRPQPTPKSHSDYSNYPEPTPSSSLEADPSLPLTTAQAAEKARLSRLAAKAAADAATSASEFAKRPVPAATAHPSQNQAAHLRDLAPYIIKDPVRVNHLESLYIDAIGRRVGEGGSRARECWSRFSHYFNGREALEGVALLEGLKRKETWGLLTMFQEHLLTVRHW